MRKLNFKLDRKSLEIIYTAFIRPLLEYGDVIWDNCAEYEKADLDKIQNEAARIATGATKLVSLYTLSNKICWETLEQRRKNHRLTLFYKMVYNITPYYLSNLLPPTVSNLSCYNLRNSNDLQTVDARTSQYYHSFLPSTTRDWNLLWIRFSPWNRRRRRECCLCLLTNRLYAMRLISKEYFRVKLAICLHDGSQIREVIDDSD